MDQYYNCESWPKEIVRVTRHRTKQSYLWSKHPKSGKKFWLVLRKHEYTTLIKLNPILNHFKVIKSFVYIWLPTGSWCFSNLYGAAQVHWIQGRLPLVSDDGKVWVTNVGIYDYCTPFSHIVVFFHFHGCCHNSTCS